LTFLSHFVEQNKEDDEDDDSDDNVKFDSDEELQTDESAAKLEPAVKEFTTPTSLTTVTVIQDLELDDSYQSSTNKKRNADEDAADEDEEKDNSKKIPSKVSEQWLK
jgi:hypothetical protein